MTGVVHRTSSGIIAGRNHTVSEVIADVVVEIAALNKGGFERGEGLRRHVVKLVALPLAMNHTERVLRSGSYSVLRIEVDGRTAARSKAFNDRRTRRVPRWEDLAQAQAPEPIETIGITDRPSFSAGRAC